MEAQKSDLVDLRMNVMRETEKAIYADDGTKRVWLPKSLVEFEVSDDGKSSLVTMPEWIAKTKGLI